MTPNSIAKFKLIQLPFLISLFSLVITYTLLYWYFYIENYIYLIDEEFTSFILPSILAILIVLIYLRPKINLLEIKNYKVELLINLISILALAAPTITSLYWITKATGKLKQVSSTSQMSSNDHFLYYSIKNHYIDKNHIGLELTQEVTGKYKNRLKLSCNYAVPLLDKEADTSMSQCNVWIGFVYIHEISNELSDSEKNVAIEAFKSSSLQRILHEDIFDFKYLVKLGKSHKTRIYKNACYENGHFEVKDPIIFEPEYTPFSERLTQTTICLVFFIFIGNIILWIFLYIYNLKPIEDAKR